MQTCKECCDNNTIFHHPLQQLVHLTPIHLSMMHNDLQVITIQRTLAEQQPKHLTFDCSVRR